MRVAGEVWKVRMRYGADDAEPVEQNGPAARLRYEPVELGCDDAIKR